MKWKCPRKIHAAMTQAIFSLLYARLGNADKAWHFFQDAYLPNLNPPFRVIAETKGGTNPYFATGAGGVVTSRNDGIWRIAPHRKGSCAAARNPSASLAKPYVERYWSKKADILSEEEVIHWRSFDIGTMQ